MLAQEHIYMQMMQKSIELLTKSLTRQIYSCEYSKELVR